MFFGLFVFATANAHDGAIVELTGVAPKIRFGPVDVPVCELILNNAGRHLESTCDLHTPSMGNDIAAVINNFTAIVTEQQQVIASLQKQLDDMQKEVNDNKVAAQNALNEANNKQPKGDYQPSGNYVSTNTNYKVKNIDREGTLTYLGDDSCDHLTGYEDKAKWCKDGRNQIGNFYVQIV